MLEQQIGPRNIEIVVVDSGSSDTTLDIAREFRAKIVQIPPERFSHSHARNLGADHAAGDYLLFTVQDALPPSPSWLRDMFAPLERHGVVAVSCGESPRPDCDLFYRVGSWYHHKFLEIETQDRIMSRPDEESQASLRKNGQLSDTACLIRKDVFLRYRYRGDYAEDLDLGLRLVRDGHRLALLGSTRIIHSHNRPAYYHLRRGYVDNLALLRIFPGHPATVVAPEPLLHDVVRTYAYLDAVAQKNLADLRLPCSPSDLQGVVSAALSPASGRPWPATTERKSHPYLDDDTIAFLENLRRSSQASPDVDLADGSVLIQAVRSFTDIMLEYVRSTHDAIDHVLLEDFRAALYKTSALQTGVLLASSYFRGDSGAREKLQTINQELTRGV